MDELVAAAVRKVNSTVADMDTHASEIRMRMKLIARAIRAAETLKSALKTIQ